MQKNHFWEFEWSGSLLFWDFVDSISLKTAKLFYPVTPSDVKCLLLLFRLIFTELFFSVVLGVVPSLYNSNAWIFWAY
jgi:hypothetical protein